MGAGFAQRQSGIQGGEVAHLEKAPCQQGLSEVVRSAKGSSRAGGDCGVAKQVQSKEAAT